MYSELSSTNDSICVRELSAMLKEGDNIINKILETSQIPLNLNHSTSQTPNNLNNLKSKTQTQTPLDLNLPLQTSIDLTNILPKTPLDLKKKNRIRICNTNYIIRYFTN